MFTQSTQSITNPPPILAIPRPRTKILKGKDILAALGYEFCLAAINYIVFISAVLGTFFSLMQIGSIPTGSESKLFGAVASSAGVWFALNVIVMTVIDVLSGKNHLKNITNAQAYAETKFYDLDYSVLRTMLSRALGAIATHLVLGGLFAKYTFSLTAEELSAFLLVISAAPLATGTVATLIALPVAKIYTKTDAHFNAQLEKLNKINQMGLAHALITAESSPAVIPQFSPVTPVFLDRTAELPYHNGHVNFTDTLATVVPASAMMLQYRPDPSDPQRTPRSARHGLV